jgi:hypothetical protein
MRNGMQPLSIIHEANRLFSGGKLKWAVLTDISKGGNDLIIYRIYVVINTENAEK